MSVIRGAIVLFGLALFLCLFASHASGQEVHGEVWKTHAADSLFEDVHYETGDWNPANWPGLAMYFKAGPSFLLGDGFFAEDNEVGYQFSGGLREKLLPNSGPVFLDFGASYMSAIGRGPTVTISGVFDEPLSAPQRLDELLDLTLSELSRVSIHSAIGWYLQPATGCENLRALLSFRFGGRIGHISGSFSEEATDALQVLIDTAVLGGRPFTLENDQLFSKTDTFGGIFLGLEVLLLRQHTSAVDISILLDAEVAHDWIDLKNYQDDGLASASVLFGINIAH